MIHLSSYTPVVGRDVMKRLYEKAVPLRGKRVVMVSSTHQGGGVAEMLNPMVPLLNELGIECGWRIVHGDPDFFSVTKKMHNLLQGARGGITSKERDRYLEINKRFGMFTHLEHHDLVVVHDPQPLPLIRDRKRKDQPWIWRCHIDLTNPNANAFKLVHPFISRYDRVVVSDPAFGSRIRRPKTIIHPAIDPLSAKNIQMSDSLARRLLREQGIDPSIPFIAQVSRYDRWKDPEGVIRVFDEVKKKVPCQLVLLGNTASDDPEGVRLYQLLKRSYGRRKDIHLLVNIPDNDRFVNAVQSTASVILQKSLREGFGLTVSEALYKGTPVVASDVGGIPLQVIDGKCGFVRDASDFSAHAECVRLLLTNPKKRADFGRFGREHVKKNFLITRLLEDWMDLFTEMLERPSRSKMF